MDDEEEEDVMGLLIATNGSDEEFVPPSGMGKGKGKSRAVAMDGVVDFPESVGASSSSRVQRKRRRKPFPDDARPKKCRRTTMTTPSSSSTWTFCHHCRCKSDRKSVV